MSQEIAERLRRPTPMAPPSPAPDLRSRGDAFVREHFAFVWRVCRRLGLPAADADDAAQRTLWTALERLDELRPGSERAFLYRVAWHTVQKARRSGVRRREEPLGAGDAPADGSDPEAVAAARRALAALDAVLDELEPELRAAFVLFEIEGLEKREVADALGIPPGTAASRLRRARAEFLARARRRGLSAVTIGAGR
ncbi:MAG TPA: sigma-70 family RNA polymerase sigma factor [Polyangiaceae bacterium]|nr:sigma-70 family RNA polymerase sigma factor [Polyangiaceae bacterium]